MGQMNRREKI